MAVYDTCIRHGVQPRIALIIRSLYAGDRVLGGLGQSDQVDVSMELSRLADVLPAMPKRERRDSTTRETFRGQFWMRSDGEIVPIR